MRRRTLLLGRWLGAVAVCVPYVVAVTLASFVLTDALGGWWPDRTLAPLAGLGLGVAIIAALALAGSVVLASTANGIAVFMLFGAGLTAGLLGQIAEAIGSDTLGDVAKVTTWALPVRGALPGRAGRVDGRHGGLHQARDQPRAVRRRPGRRPRAVALLARLSRRGRRAGRPRLRQARPLTARAFAGRDLDRRPRAGLVQAVLDRERRARVALGRGARLPIDAEGLGELAGLVHLRDDVGAADQLAVDEELRDRRPVRQLGELLADPRVGEDVHGGERLAERLQCRDGACGEAAARVPRACPS